LQAVEDTVRVRAGDGFVKVEAEPDRALRVDDAGRWITARFGSTTLRRKVDGGVFVARAGTGASVAVGEDAPADGPWHPRVAALAADLRGDLAAAVAGAYPLEAIPEDAVSRADAALARAAALGSDDYVALGRRFAEVYAEPVPILPPDRYKDLVVLPAVGCPHGVCTFCAWYQDARFRAFSDDDLRAHLDGLEELFGAGLRARDGLFLGSASGLSVADARLLRLIDLVVDRFGRPPRGIAAFLDPHHAPRRDPAAWGRLADRGLVRAVVGLETGDPALRQRLGKSPDLAPLRDAVAAMRAGGVGAGITVLAGAVRPEDVPTHHAATVAFLAGLELDQRDLVYVSPLDDAPDPAAAAREATALTRALRDATGAKVSPYRVDLYRYFA
jgi:hypothetical protein